MCASCLLRIYSYFTEEGATPNSTGGISTSFPPTRASFCFVSNILVDDVFIRSYSPSKAQQAVVGRIFEDGGISGWGLPLEVLNSVAELLVFVAEGPSSRQPSTGGQP